MRFRGISRGSVSLLEKERTNFGGKEIVEDIKAPKPKPNFVRLSRRNK
jgi:hypothetical protein